MEMKLLLHACCAPCSIKCVESLKNENIEPSIFWYNPNIHPLKEHMERRLALQELCRTEELNFINHGKYGLREFLYEIDSDYYDKEARCEYCYKKRLFGAARFAGEQGYSHFSTTLLISPYQNHELIAKIGCEAENLYGVKFLYHDFRPLFREGQECARNRGIYMQKYCGCIFSEEERYSKK